MWQECSKQRQRVFCDRQEEVGRWKYKGRMGRSSLGLLLLPRHPHSAGLWPPLIPFACTKRRDLRLIYEVFSNRVLGNPHKGFCVQAAVGLLLFPSLLTHTPRSFQLAGLFIFIFLAQSGKSVKVWEGWAEGEGRKRSSCRQIPSKFATGGDGEHIYGCFLENAMAQTTGEASSLRALAMLRGKC